MDWITLAGLSLAVMGAASTGAMFSPGEWYETLEKPAWTPPKWLFPLAWTALYIAMAWAAYRVAQAPLELAAPALAFWAAQIVLNAVWSPVFFGLRRLGAALVVLCLMWVAVVMTTVLAFRADTLAGLLLAPYVVWVSYAGALNAVIWRNNPA
ncbi:tryptophan-rich sensory protein TspO [Oceanibium sediminis]|uniref:tryptophan-rich sensory protein TspO n=1 Tax=Oceanibium sediminis TaxID=2026339 RepID=UPI000DD4AFFA|nr:TspO/MBR family protein [Oceanibium sediminis]